VSSWWGAFWASPRPAELDRLNERSRDGATLVQGGRKPELRRAGDRRRVEGGIAARLLDAGGIRDDGSSGIDKEPEQDLSLDPLLEQGLGVSDR
jgi:hypothetical protein